MSDSNQFGSAGTAVAEPPAEEALAASKGPKPVVLVAVVVGVLVLAAAAYFLLFAGGGSTDESATGAVPKGTVAAPAGSKAPSASAKPVTSKAPQTVTGSGGRDPFAPLVVAASGSASAAPSAGSTSGTTAGTAVPSGLTETITLVKLNASGVSADVTVNGTKYTGVKRGQVFAKYFSLDIITGSSQAQFLFGDSNVVLTVGKSLTLRT